MEHAMHRLSLLASLLLGFFSAFTTGAAFADDFESIFDGKTLKGWKALDMTYWSVRDGAITGESTPDHPCTLNQFLVWQGGDVADFELKLKFRVTGNGGNTGVQIRSVLRPDGLAVGYQADILTPDPISAASATNSTRARVPNCSRPMGRRR